MDRQVKIHNNIHQKESNQSNKREMRKTVTGKGKTTQQQQKENHNLNKISVRTQCNINSKQV